MWISTRRHRVPESPPPIFLPHTPPLPQPTLLIAPWLFLPASSAPRAAAQKKLIKKLAPRAAQNGFPRLARLVGS